MNSSLDRLLTVTFTITLILVFAPSDAFAGRFRNPFRKQTPVERLAQEIDDLEEHLERYGSIVAKQPDVWGEARLTKHRADYERIMETMLDQFPHTINAALFRSDQAFLASAMAIGSAVTGFQGIPVTDDDGNTTFQQTTPVTFGMISDPGDPQPTVFFRGDPRAEGSPDPLVLTPDGPAPSEGIGLEPAVMLDQMSRYLNHLNELRRINEGGDVADAPGYALHLVRIPVSILPGDKTRQGYGAEITITVEPNLSEELLPMTFRNLVVNDLIDQLALPLTGFLGHPDAPRLLQQLSEDEQLIESATYELPVLITTLRTKVVELLSFSETQHWLKGVQIQQDPVDYLDEPLIREAIGHEATLPGKIGDIAREIIDHNKRLRELTADVQALAYVEELSKQVSEHWPIPHLPAGRNRRARLAFPPTQLLQIYGTFSLGYVARDASNGFANDPVTQANRVVHLTDVYGFLESEFHSAYEFLAQPEHAHIWTLHCTPELARAIRERREGDVSKMRIAFYRSPEVAPLREKPTTKTTRSLAWAILVEAALLNEKLIEDMREQATAKGCACMIPAEGMPFFLPNPPAEARAAFNEYVRCRWPIHVFALDPVNQEQNVADAFSMRRELQLAMAVGFAMGHVSGENLTRFARRIELDIDTIALHRTQVGFSHGSDTFGWRFYPRIQTPEIESNFTTIFRDQLIGGPRRDDLIKQYRIEPGAREAVALIVMPSFVPYATFDMRSNWFKLTDPSKKELDAEEGVELGKSVQNLRLFSSQCLWGGEAYRAEDLNGLLRTVEQIEARLPFQTAMVQIPHENTLGGFEMFSTGVTDLAPELKGYYGEPGFKQDGGATVYLVGNHFSIHGTRVVAGNRDVTKSRKLISRQVMQITIPKHAHLVNGRVDVHVATPYGVSNHLLIHVADPPPAPPAGSGFFWDDPPQLLAYLQYEADPTDAKVGCIKALQYECDTEPGELTVVGAFPELASMFTDNASASAEIAMWIHAIAEDGTPIRRIGGTVGPREITFKANDPAISASVPFKGMGELSELILNELKSGLKMSDNVDAVAVEAFLRFKKDGLPIVKLDNVIRIDLVELE